ncbi:hypothetical protein JCM8547_002869 [Rhodosporidiobolus lusitaniae]
MSTTATATLIEPTATLQLKPAEPSSAAVQGATPDTPPLTRPSSPSPTPRRARREQYAPPSTHYLDAYTSQRYSPALGLVFERGIQLRDVLRLPDGDERKEALLEELAYTISLHGVCVFPKQDLTQDELGELALALGRASGAPETSGLHIHPTAELGENGRPTVATISNVAEKGGRQISFAEKGLISSGLHSDISFEPTPARYSMLRMHTLPPLGGNTQFNSAYAHYDMLSEPMKAFLSGLKAVHSGAVFREQANKHGYKLHLGPRGAPENVGDDFTAEHPIIRTNAVTGFQELFVNQTFTERIVGLGYDESRAILDYLFKLQSQAHDAMLSYRWNTDDLCIWDNSAVNHCATFDYREKRAGDRTVCVGEIPYYDPNGKSRKETTGSCI